MAEYTREQVIAEAKQLAKMLAQTEDIERFTALEEKVNNNERVQRLITRTKAMQKQAVNLQAYDKKEALAKVDAEIEKLQAELDEIPVVQEFKEIQVTVNDVLQLISGTIAREVTNYVVAETEGDIMTGETGSKVKRKEPCEG